MLKKNGYLALIVLLTAALACNFFTGAGNKSPRPTVDGDKTVVNTPDANLEEPTLDAQDTEAATEQVLTEEPTVESSGGTGNKKYDTEFPLPEGVNNFTDLGNGSINFQTKISIEDAVAFYRESFAKAGYKERTINTSITDTTFSLVFDGHSSGKEIVVQGVDLGGGTTNINIRLESM